MAEKKLDTSYETLMNELQARHFAPVYLLMGDEPYYIDKIADYIGEHVLDEAERDFNQTVVFGSDVTAVQVADMARRYPMMSDYQVVMVKEAQNLRNLEALDRYVEKQLLTSTILVLCPKNGTLDRRKKANSSLIENVKRNGGVVFESNKMKETELPYFIESYLQPRNATIDYKASQMIAEHIGADLSRLASELDKVLISLAEGDRRVTPEIVESRIGISKEFNSFELRAAIINRDIYKANQIAKYFDKNPKSGSVYSILPILFNYFQNLMLAYYAPDKSNGNALAQYLGLRGSWAVRDYMTGLRNYSGMKTMQIISKIREIDAKSKGLDNPNTGSGELLKELIFFILH